MINISKTTYKQFGNCIAINNGKIEILVTTDIGPRIIYAGLVGGENIMFEDTNNNITMPGEYFDKLGKGIWHIYGGHRLWKSPEDITSYYPDNCPVQVEMLENGAIFSNEPMADTLIQKSMRITMTEDNQVEIMSYFTNHGNTPTEKVALWGLNVMDKGAQATIPLSTKNTGLLANRNLVLWSYTDITDSRLKIANDSITLTWDEKPPLKIGAIIEEPIKVITKGVEFIVVPEYDPTKDYADFSCNAEFYTNHLMMEIETLSSLESILPGETKAHKEVWKINKA